MLSSSFFIGFALFCGGIVFVFFLRWATKYANEFQKGLCLNDEGNNAVGRVGYFANRNRGLNWLIGGMVLFVFVFLSCVIGAILCDKNAEEGLKVLAIHGGVLGGLLLASVIIGCILFCDIKKMKMIKLGENGIECPKCKEVAKFGGEFILGGFPLKCSKCDKVFNWDEIYEKLIKGGKNKVTSSGKVDNQELNAVDNQEVNTVDDLVAKLLLWYFFIISGYFIFGALLLGK